MEALLFGIIGSIIAAIIVGATTSFWKDSYFFLFSSDRKIKKIFIEINNCIDNKHNFDSDAVKRIFLNLFKRKIITKATILSFNDKESAIFLFGLQFFYKEILLSEELNTDDLTLLANRSANCIEYKRLLLKLSLSSFPIDKEDLNTLANTILNKGGIIQVGFKFNNADEKLIERMKYTEKDDLFIFSTTSQISNFQYDIFHSNEDKINKLNLFMVSPLIISHGALINLKEEYDVPAFAIPKLQFVTGNFEFDLLRRIIKIIHAIENLYNFKIQSNITTNLYLFKDKYPDMKIVLFKNTNYLQLFPNPLKYVNNIYRFGLEFTDIETISKIYKDLIENIINSGKVEKVELNLYNIQELKKKAIDEIYWYLTKNNQNIESLDQFRTDFNLILRNKEVNYYLDKIIYLDKITKEFTHNNSLNQIAPIIDVNKTVEYDTVDVNKIVIKQIQGKSAHISIGILFFDECKNKILVITKNQSPYKGKKSIVAGHIEIGESPYMSIIREVKEEIGINISNFSFLKKYDLIEGDICRYNSHNHIWYLFVSNELISTDNIVLSESEIDKVEWMEIDKLHTCEFTYATKFIFQDLSLI